MEGMGSLLGKLGRGRLECDVTCGHVLQEVYSVVPPLGKFQNGLSNNWSFGFVDVESALVDGNGVRCGKM